MYKYFIYNLICFKITQFFKHMMRKIFFLTLRFYSESILHKVHDKVDDNDSKSMFKSQQGRLFPDCSHRPQH